MNQLSIGSRIFDFETSIEETIQYSADNSYYCELSHYCIIDVVGEHAKTYLQGQLTNDLLNLKPNEISKQLLCNLKGQIIAKIFVFEFNNQLHFMLPSDLWQDVHQLLEKTASLSKVSFQENQTLKVYGIVSKSKIPHTFKLNDIQSLMFSNAPVMPSHCSKKTKLFWHYISLTQAEFNIYPSTCRQYLPKPLGLEKEWIHFNKGCYRGQEIIARMHFLGKDKYTIEINEIDWNSETEPNQILIDYCPIDEKRAIAVLIKRL